MAKDDLNNSIEMYANGTEDDGRRTRGAGGPERLDPLFDDAFVRIFGSEESKSMTGRFVDCILEAAGLDPMGEMESIRAGHAGIDGSVSCKSARFDVKVIAQKGILNPFAQCRKAPVTDRSIFYASRLMSTATETSTDFRELPRVVVVTLYDALPMFPDSNGYIAVHRPEWHIGDDVYPGSDRMIFVLVELGKFRIRHNGFDEGVLEDELTAWLYLLTNGYGSEEETEAMGETFPAMKEFALQYGFAMGDPKLVWECQDYNNAVRGEMAYWDRVKSRAKERRLAEERAEERAEIIAKLRSLGIEEHLISQLG